MNAQKNPGTRNTNRRLKWERSVFLIFFILFIYFYFGCAGSLLLLELCSGCREWGSSLVVVCGLLVAGLTSTGSGACGLPQLLLRALEHGLDSCARGLRGSVACGSLAEQGLSPCLLHWHSESLPLSYQGIPCLFYF